MSQQEPFAHPGRILFEQVMQPLGVSRNKLAREIGVPVGRISDIVNGKRGITPDSALRLAKYFGTTAELWMRLQSDHDLFCSRRDSWPQIESNVQVFSTADAGSELEALCATASGQGKDTGSEDIRPSEMDQATQAAGNMEGSPLDESGELPEMGQILQFSAPGKSDDQPPPDISTADNAKYLVEATGDGSPAPHPGGSVTAGEFDFDPDSPDNCLEIPDPNEFRFREKPVSANSPD